MFLGVRGIEDPHNLIFVGSGPPDPQRIGAYVVKPVTAH